MGESQITITLTRPYETTTDFINTLSNELLRSPSHPNTPLSAIIDTLLNTPSLVAIDGFEHANSREIGVLIEQIVQQTKKHSRFLLSSQTNLEFQFQDLILSGEATLIRENDLVLSLTQTQDLLYSNVDHNLLSDQLTQQIYTVTEGWALAVKLCGQLLNQYRNSNVVMRLANGDLPFLTHYFQQAAIDKLPERSIELLCYIAHFDQFSSKLCTYLFPNQETLILLSYLTKHHIFIAIEQGTNNEYRLHPLFRHFLVRLDCTPKDSDLKHIMAKAAQWASDHGCTVLAIDCAIKANNYRFATELINQSVQTFIRDQGMLPKLIIWCQKIPLESSSASIHLHFWLAWTFTFSCLFDRAERSIKQLNDLLEQDESLAKAEKQLLKAKIESIQLALAIFQDKSEWTFLQTDIWLEQYSPIADPFDTAVVASGRFLSARLQLEVNAAKSAMTIAKEAITRADSFYGRMWIDALDGLNEMEFGDHRVASKLLATAHSCLASSERHASPMRSTIALLQAKALYEQGLVSQASELLEDGLTHIQDHGLTESAAAGVRLEFYLALRASPEKARYVLSQAEFLVGHFTPRLLFVVRSLRIELFLREGNLESALQEARNEGICIDQAQEVEHNVKVPFIRSERARVTALLNYHGDRFTSAATIIEQILAQTSTSQRPLFHTQTLILYCATLMQSKQTNKALRTLIRAMKVADKAGLYQTFVDHKRYIEHPLQELVLRRQRENILTEDQLILRLEQDFQILKHKTTDADSPICLSLSEREQELLMLLPSSLTIQQMADYLFVSKATIKTHLHHIYRKLGVKNRTGAIESAKRYHLL
ncbi:helix-turn-helix transcriptional regulator [Halioxenophilus aromaticivorans]|uniref:HTH luxR-type domain-containing protein n=1 Tax=Halioxenophilus aromaticivorans TaxID=1306992 RepID=A0AAV3U028_9ALTE